MGKYLLLLLLLLPEVALAQGRQFEADFDEEKPWLELQAQLPSYPKAENLIPFQVSPAIDNRYFVDTASISVGDDGVVRYTVVVKTSGGATNVSFEGVRCATRERKLYAFGRADDTWSRARSSKWERIEPASQSAHQLILYHDFFCPDLGMVKTQKEAVDALKRGMHPAAVKP